MKGLKIIKKDLMVVNSHICIALSNLDNLKKFKRVKGDKSFKKAIEELELAVSEISSGIKD